MKSKYIIMLGFICLPMVWSTCSLCDGDCKSTYVFFDIVDSNGKNVFSNPDPMFDFNSVRITWTSPSGQVMESELLSYNEWEVGFEIFPHIHEYIIRYSASEADMITIRPSISDSKCCGETVDDFELDVNGVELCTSCDRLVLTLSR
jgi:hypothetical protein